ncbi:MAG: DUF6597 domain-containing transcriptional factor [Fimbriimonadaceae bacterium]
MSAVPTMRFREMKPEAGLARFVACYWEFVVGPETPVGHVHTIPPDGCVSVSCMAGHGSPGMVGPRLESLHQVLRDVAEESLLNAPMEGRPPGRPRAVSSHRCSP